MSFDMLQRQKQKALTDAGKRGGKLQHALDTANTRVGRLSDSLSKLRLSIELHADEHCTTCDGKGVIKSTSNLCACVNSKREVA